MMIICSATHEGHENKEAWADYDICPAARYWDQHDYHTYMETHGCHFTKEMAHWAVSMFENNDGTKGAHWTCEEVHATMKKLGYDIPEALYYDVYYEANHKYSDHFGGSLKTPESIMMYVHEMITDIDGDPTSIFDMWLTKAMRKCWAIDWAKMM